ncbi:replicative DNA helicase [Natronoflexus pectinivorans]|uniref:Replicative DNA helicase n=1 Tax=Natronoflexus pectinivorans TaxID=682526 RepID=A0A4R2GH61_9BACT|nr:replicative DNA helicase [Natronoflexus pectinivorans]TCO07667.1 replicative DNA helicase [Natronoflexus pectinivorans]
MAEKRYNNRKKSPEPMDFGVGKMPPQAIELEEAVLGAMLLEKDAFTNVSEILKTECFYKEAHQHIYEAITSLFARQEPADLLTVTEELRRMAKLEEVGGAFYITQLTGRVASAAHIEYHSRIIYQKYLQREMIRISGVIQTKAFDESEDVNDLLEEAENSLFMLSQGSMKRDATQISPVINEAIEMIQVASKRTDGLSGVPSGFTELDRMTSGWQNSDMVVIAARPAMGKTAFVLSMARNMAVKYNQAVAVFSLEMSNVQLVNRLIVAETELAAEKIKTGKLEPYEWEQLDHKIKSLVDAPIFVDDTAGLSVFELRAKCRRLKKQHDLKIIIIDYLQLMNASGMNPGNRQEEVSMISRSLKGLAKELNVPILALSQLNRGVESRTGEGKRPQLSDLRESGAIEQDADMVLFIHRPEYYKITEDENGNSLIGMAEIIIAKHRNGATGDVRLRFRPEVIRFEDVDVDGFGGGYGGESDSMQVFSSKMNETISTGSPAPGSKPDFGFGGNFERDAEF